MMQIVDLEKKGASLLMSKIVGFAELTVLDGSDTSDYDRMS